MVQQNVGWSWQLWCFFCWRRSIIHRHHWTYTNARRLQSVLHPENRTYWPCRCSYRFLHCVFAFWSFLHHWRRIKTRDRSGACLGVDVQHHCFREGAFGGQNGVRIALVWRKGGKMAWRLFCSLFFKKVKFGPQIREPCVWFDSCGFWFIKD